MRVVVILLLLGGLADADSVRQVTASNSAIDTSGSSEFACARAKYAAYQRLQDSCHNWYAAALKEALSEYVVYNARCDCKAEQSGAVTCSVNVQGSCTVDAERRALFGIGRSIDRGQAEQEALRNVANYCYAPSNEKVIESSLFGCQCGTGRAQNECVCYGRGICQKPGGRFRVGDAVSVEWRGKWYPCHVLRVDGARFFIHYDGYDSSWDEWVTEARIRK